CHRVGPDVVTVRARRAPLHRVFGEAARPLVLVRLVHQAHREAHQLVRHRQRHPVVIRDEVFPRPSRPPSPRPPPLPPHPPLREGDEDLGEETVDSGGHRPQRGLYTSVDVMFTGLASVSRTGDFRSMVSLTLRTLSSGAELWIDTV